MKDFFVITFSIIIISYCLFSIVQIFFKCIVHNGLYNGISLRILKKFIIKIVVSGFILFFLSRIISLDISNFMINFCSDIFDNKFLGILGSLYLTLPLLALDSNLLDWKWNDKETWVINTHSIFFAYQIWVIWEAKGDLYYDIESKLEREEIEKIENEINSKKN